MGSESPAAFRRRNSVSSIIPTTPLLHLSSAHKTQNQGLATFAENHGDGDGDFELSSLRRYPSAASSSSSTSVSPSISSYTSLRELLPPSPGIQSPTPATQSCHDISIRNRLVKQAAWAYLQPMPSSPSSVSASSCSSIRALHRICLSSGSGFLDFFRCRLFPAIRNALRRLLRAVLSVGVGRNRCP